MTQASMAHLDGKLSLLMPAFNEGAIIYQNALLAGEQIKSLADDYEILIISDGSTDNTLEQAQLAGTQNACIRVLHYSQNMGKGYALREGAMYATGDYIALCDADLDLAPSQLSCFITLMRQQNADVVIGSKMHTDSQVEYPFFRRIFSWGYYLFLLLLFQLDTKDTQTGLKLFRAEVLKPIMQRILVKRFAFDIEVLSIAKHRGYRIVSAPVKVVFHRATFGRIGWQDIRNMIIDTLAVFYRLRILHFYDRAADDEASGRA